MLAFIHIPKTGGSYLGKTTVRHHHIGRVGLNSRNVIKPMINLGHTAIGNNRQEYNYLHYPRKESESFWHNIHTKEVLSEYDVFTNVRNPFAWLVSWAATSGGWGSYGKTKTHYEYANASKDFKRFIKTVATREEYWPSKKFLFFQMFDSNGDMVVDWVNRAEELDMDLELMAKHYGVQYTAKERENVSDHKDYRLYYDDELIDIVLNTWGREIKLFGYTFVMPQVPEELPGRMTINRLNHMKDRIKYFIEDDLLFVDGKIYTGK